MRGRLLLLIAGWLLGLIIGLGHWPVPSVVVAMGILSIALLLNRVAQPYIAATAALLFLGWVWTGVATPVIVVHQDCLRTPIIATVSRAISRKENSLNYLLATDSGCRYLLTATAEVVYGQGDVLEVNGKLESVAAIAQALPDYAAYLDRQGVDATIRYGSVELKKPAQSWVAVFRAAIKNRLNALYLEPEASLGNAMLLNEASALPQAVIDHFRMTGVSHVLAISGSNITLLVGVLLLCLWPLQLSPWRRSVLLLALLWAYMVLIGRPVSAVRAGYFWSFAILALRLSRLIPLPTIIIATVTVMASVNPLVLGDVSFQLSVGAVVGIGLALWLAQPWILPDHLVNIKTIVLSTLGATIMTGPIIAYWFGTVSLLGLPANLLVVPLISILFLLMVVSIPVSFVVPILASLITFIVHVLWIAIDKATTSLAAVPYGYMQNITPSAQFMIGYYVILLSGITWLVWKQRRTWREIWQ